MDGGRDFAPLALHPTTPPHPIPYRIFYTMPFQKTITLARRAKGYVGGPQLVRASSVSCRTVRERADGVPPPSHLFDHRCHGPLTRFLPRVLASYSCHLVTDEVVGQIKEGLQGVDIGMSLTQDRRRAVSLLRAGASCREAHAYVLQHSTGPPFRWMRSIRCHLRDLSHHIHPQSCTAPITCHPGIAHFFIQHTSAALSINENVCARASSPQPPSGPETIWLLRI